MTDVKLARTIIRQLVEEGEVALGAVRTDLLERDADEELLKEILMGWVLFMRRSKRTYLKAADALGGLSCAGGGPCQPDGE